MKKTMILCGLFLLSTFPNIAYVANTKAMNVAYICTGCTTFNCTPGCRCCNGIVAVNCMSTCDFCVDSGLCWNERPIPETIEQSPALLKSGTESQPSEIQNAVNLQFDKNHLLQLADLNPTLALVIGRTQNNPTPLDTIVTIHWTQVKITKSDVEELLKGNNEWLENYIERVKEATIKGEPTAIFNVVITKLKDNQLKYRIHMLNPPTNELGSYSAYFDLIYDQASDKYVSSKWTMQ